MVTSSPSASPSPTPLTDEELLALIPEGARAENFGSAVNFARFFLNLYPQLFARENSQGELFQLLSGDNCGFCENALQNMAATHELGAYTVGSEYSFPDSIPEGGLGEEGYWYVSERVEVSSATTFGPDGTEIDAAPAGMGGVRIRLFYDVDHWIVDIIDFDIDEVA